MLRAHAERSHPAARQLRHQHRARQHARAHAHEHARQLVLMLHANAFAADTQQQASSPRNRDAFFSTNWIMPMAQRGFGARGRGGELTLRTMLSVEPATIGSRNYPELFQQGETAYGKPIVDGQHPHDFFMEVAALYDLALSPNTLLCSTPHPSATPPSAPPRIRTGSPQAKTPSPRWAITRKTPRTSPSTWSPAASPTEARVELTGFHGAEPTNTLASNPRPTATPSTPCHPPDDLAHADWTAQYSFAHITGPRPFIPAKTSSARPPA